MRFKKTLVGIIATLMLGSSVLADPKQTTPVPTAQSSSQKNSDIPAEFKELQREFKDIPLYDYILREIVDNGDTANDVAFVIKEIKKSDVSFQKDEFAFRLYVEKKGRFSEARKAIERLKEQKINYKLDAIKLRRYAELGIHPTAFFFEDTNKPNSLVVFPYSDKNGSFYESVSKSRILHAIMKSNDTKVVIAKEEGEVYDALDSMKNISFWWLGGHGTNHTLKLGEPSYSKKNERFYIDVDDIELAKYMRKAGVRTVLLSSCYSGEGGDISENTANFVQRSGNINTIVYASREKSASYKLVNINPFEVKCLDKDGKDITYVAKFLN